MPRWRLTFLRKALIEEEIFFKEGHTATLQTRWKDEAWETDDPDIAKNTPSEGPFSPNESGWDCVGKGLTAELYWAFSEGIPETLQVEIEENADDFDALFELGWDSGGLSQVVHGPLSVTEVA